MISSSIEETYREYQKVKITTAVVARLRKKHPVTVYNDVLQKNLLSVGITTVQ